jgi:hypothetical protein
VCEIDITNIAGAPAPAWSDPPVITAQSVHGVSGQERRFYGATLITPYGESSMSNIVECNGASVRNMSNYNEISGTFENGDAANPNKVRIWYGPSVDHMVGWLDEANYSGPGVFGYYDGAANWPSVTRDENDIIKYMDAPLSNNAQNNPNIFSVMSPCIGYGYDFLDIFGSNLADGAEPARAVIPAADHGSTTITNKDPQWPFPDPWIELNGVKITAFLQRGPKLQHHRDGSVTMSCNLAGPFDNAGKLIDQAFRQWMFLLNEHCVKNNGTGFRNGTYGTLERYANGDALIKTEDFEKAQEQSKLWTGDGVGYQGNIWITDPEETWRDVLQKLCQSFGARFTATRFGQMKAFLVPTEDDGATGLRHFREKIEIKRSEKPQLAHDEVINKGKLSYFWDPDLGDFRGKEIPVINETSIAQQVPGGVPGGKDKRGERPHDFNLWYTAYATTATDVVAREMMRRKRRPRYPSITLPLLGLDYDIGDICKLTDSKGLGAAGDVGIKVQILKHETHPNEDEVTLVFQDLRGIAVAREVASAD